VADGTFDGIPDNTTIQSIDSSSQITMSANATATGTGRGVNYGKTSILLNSGHGLLDGNGSTTRYAVINNVDRISYTDIDNNMLTGIPLTGEYAIGQSHADGAKIMQNETNAYFTSGDLPEVDKWYLVVGYVQGMGDTDYTDRGAVYDGETGNRVGVCGNFQWWSQTTYVKNRVYMYYSDDSPEQIQHAFDPRFEEISGAPQINTLLGGKITTGMTIKNDVSDISPTSGYVSLGEHSGTLEVNTEHGYLRLGAANSSYNHIQGENAKFYFNKPLVIDGGNTSGSAYQISSYSSEDLVLATQDGAENRITIKSDTGNVGIGVTSPAAKLQVLQNNAAWTILAGADLSNPTLTDDTRKFMRLGMPHYDTDEQSFSLITGDTDNGTNKLFIGGGTSVGNAATHIFFNTAADSTTTTGTTRMTIKDSGKVGIGTTSPDGPLHIYHTDNTGVPALKIETDASASPSDCIFRMQESHGSDTYIDFTVNTFGQLEISGGAGTRRPILTADDPDTDTSGVISLNKSHYEWDTQIFGDSSTPVIFVDGTNNRMGVNTGSPASLLHVYGEDPILTLEDTSIGVSALSRTMAGINIISGGMNASSAQYGTAVKFLSHDDQFTTENPKFLAAIAPRATETYDGDTDGGMALDFAVTDNAQGTTNVPLVRMTVDHTGYVGIGTTHPARKLHVQGSANDEVVALFTTVGGTGGSTQGKAHIGLSHFSSDSTPSVTISAEEIDDSDHRADLVLSTRTSASSNATPTEKLRITSDGSIKSSLTNLNTCVAYFWNRSDMNTNSANLKAVSHDAASSQNHWGFIMPKSGRVKYFTLNTRNHTVTSSNVQTWKINRNNNNGGTTGVDHFVIDVAKGATQDDTGVSGDATMELTQSSHSSTIWRGAVVVNFSFNALDEIRIQRTNANSVDMGDTSGVMYVEFD